MIELVLAAMIMADKPNASTPPVITVTVSETGYHAPATLSSGLTTIRFVNETDAMHMAHLVKIQGAHSVDELVEAYAEAVRTRGPRPEWMTRFGGPMAEPHSTAAHVTQNLEPGLYAWVCGLETPDGTIHFTAGEAQELVVLPANDQTASLTVPLFDNVIQLIDYAFALQAPLQSGPQTLKIENLGPEPHEVAIARLAPGMSLADVEAWFNDPQGPPPATVVGAVTALAPSLTAYLELDLTPGSYVLLCFVSAPDGRPHIEHGMIQQVRVM
jgi:hypothetical protein